MDANSSANASRHCGSAGRTTSPPVTEKGSLLSRYTAIFVNRRDRYLTAGADSSWFSKKSRLTNRVLESALRGNLSLGLYATAEDGTSRWICWDSDDDLSAHKLHQAVHLLPANSYLIERSRRGLHVFRLFAEPIPWQAAQRYGVAFAHKADCQQIEVFPKNGTFSAIRGPMTPHPLTKRICDWIDADGQIVNQWDTLMTLSPTPLPEHWLHEPPSRDPPRELHRELPGISGQLATGTHAEMLAEALRYVDLKQVGPERYQGRCCFHADDRPSFGIDGIWFECFAKCLWPEKSRGGLALFRKVLRERGMS